jgi:hypothetical protein
MSINYPCGQNKTAQVDPVSSANQLSAKAPFKDPGLTLLNTKFIQLNNNRQDRLKLILNIDYKKRELLRR